MIRLSETGSFQREGVRAIPSRSALTIEVLEKSASWARAFALPKKALYAPRYEASLEILSQKGAWGGLGFGKSDMGFHVLISQSGNVLLRGWLHGEYQDKKAFLLCSKISFPGKLTLVYDGIQNEIIASWNGEKLFGVVAVESIGIPAFVTFDRVEIVTFPYRGLLSGMATYGNLSIDLR